MTKSLFTKIWINFALLIMLSVSCDSPKTDPNILLIVADDLGWHDVGYHGSEIKTPIIDNLASTGVILEQFYVSPTCSPTRASLLSGRAASRFGILGPIAGKSTQVLPIEAPSLAETLKNNGYATAISGKWHLGLRPENGPHKYGFEYTYGYLHGQIDPYTHRYKYGDRTWHRNNVFVDEQGHATDLITNEAIQYIKEHRDKNKPFFLYVPFSVPHFPLNEEAKWVSAYTDSIENEYRRTYAAATTHMDDAIGQLLKALDDEKIRENTLVVFISDNGAQENWLDTADQYEGRYNPHDQLGDNRPLRDWKASLYEGGIRVPAILNWPGKLEADQINDIISVNDIFPTLASISGAALPDNSQFDGQNIAPILFNDSQLEERALYWRTPNQFAIRKGDWKLIHNGKTIDQGTSELYNINNDPYEKHDVALDYSDILAELMEELKTQVEQDAQDSR